MAYDLINLPGTPHAPTGRSITNNPSYSVKVHDMTAKYCEEIGMVSNSVITYIKIKRKVKTFIAFMNVEIWAFGYARRDESSIGQELVTISIPMECVVEDIVGDPDGYVQRCIPKANNGRISKDYLISIALNKGFHIPQLEDPNKIGELDIDMYFSDVECTFDFRSEIDSTGWDWQPPELAQAPANAR